MTTLTTPDGIGRAIPCDDGGIELHGAELVEDGRARPSATSRRRMTAVFALAALVLGGTSAYVLRAAPAEQRQVPVLASGPVGGAGVHSGRNGAVRALTAADFANGRLTPGRHA